MKKITPLEAATLLGISIDKLAILGKRGLVHPSHFEGNAVFYSLDEILQIKERRGRMLSDDAEVIDAGIQRDVVSSTTSTKKILTAAGGVLFSYLLLIIVCTGFFSAYPKQTTAWFGFTAKPQKTLSRQAEDANSNVLAASTSTDVSQTTLIQTMLWPVGKTSLGIVKVVNPSAYSQVANETILDPNQVLSLDASGAVIPTRPLNISDSSLLKIGSGLVANLNSQYLQGRTPGTAVGDIAIVGSAGASNTISQTSLLNPAAANTPTPTPAPSAGSVSGLTNSNLSGSAAISNGNLANSSLVINTAGPLTGGGSVSLGSSITLDCPSCTSAVSGLTISNFASPNISQWTNDAGYITTAGITLPNVGSPGTYGTSLNIPVLTTDAKGRVTGVTDTPILGITAANLSAGNYSSVINSGTYSINISGNAAAATNFSGSLSGDVSGTQTGVSVDKIKGVALGITTAASGNLLIGNGLSWATQPLSGDATIDGSGGLNINYAVAQSADATHKGFLKAADWSTFNAKQSALGYSAENSSNKSTSIVLGTSDTLYPTQNAVKTYVDNLTLGLNWQNPVELVNVIADASSPVVSPVNIDGYIINTGGNTGAWAGFNPGDLVQYQSGSWVLIKSLGIGDRFGVAFKSSTTPSGALTGKSNYMAQVTGGSAGAFTYTFTAPANNDALFVENPNAYYHGVSFTYSSALVSWVQLSSSVSFVFGNGLTTVGTNVSLGPLTSDWNQTGVFNITTAGNINLNGGNLNTTSGTASLFNSNATTLNIGGAATTIGLGAAGATVTGGGALAIKSGDGNALTLDSATTGGVNVGTGANIKAVAVGNNTVGTTLALTGGTIWSISTAGILSTTGNIATTDAGTITSAGLLTASSGLTLTTGALNLTGTSGALTLSGLSTSSINSGVNNLTFTSGNFNTTATGVNSTAIGASTPSTGAFTTINGQTETLSNTINQLVLGTTNTITISSLAPSVSRTATIPALSASDTFAFLSQNQVLTNKTIDAAGNTISNLVNSNLSGTAGITNANLANSSVTVSTTGPLSGGGGLSLGGTLTLTCPTCSVSGGSLFTAAATSGSNSTISQGGTLTLTAGTNITTTNNGSGTITLATVNNPTFSGLVTASNGLTLTTGALNLTATSGAINLSGLSASSISVTGSQTFTSSNTTGTGASSGFVFNASSLSSGTALRLTSTSTSGLLFDQNATQTSGTIDNLAYGAPTTLTGSLTGINLDLSTNLTATGQNVTGISLSMPAGSNIANTTKTGLIMTSGAITQNTVGATGTVVGADITMGALTLTSGTGLNSMGIRVTTGNLTQTAGALDVDGVKIDSTNSTITTGGTLDGLHIAAPTTIPTVGTYNNIFLGTSTSGVANTKDQATIAVGNIASTATQNFSTLQITNGGSGYLDVELLHGFINFQGMNTLYDDFTNNALDTNKWVTLATGGASSCAIGAGSSTAVGGLLVMSAGNGGANRACELATRTMTTLNTGYYQRGNNPTFETRLAVADLTNDVVYAGFTDTRAPLTSTNTNPSTNHAYIAKRSTDTNWQCVTDDGTATESFVDTGVPIVANTFYRLRVEVRNGTTPQTICVVDNGTITRVTNTAHQPGATSPMDVYMQIDVIANTTIKTMNVDYVRVWQDDPIGNGVVVNSSPTELEASTSATPVSTPASIILSNADLSGLLDLVSTQTNPDGTVNDRTGLVSGIQTEQPLDPVAVINKKIADEKNFIADFLAARITAIRGYFDEVFAKKVHTEELCVKKSDGTEACINGDQLNNLLPSPTPTPVESEPTVAPSVTPSAAPMATGLPAETASPSPVDSPTTSLTESPSPIPSASPTASPQPTDSPSPTP